ncbi:MAG: 50S ribosomal protein L11 [Thermoplasmatota archaeon]
MGQTVDTIVDGGAANAGPLGPALGPTGVNIGQVVQAINEKTKDFKGLKVPVSIEIDDKKGFTISVGTPPASELIKEKAKIQKGSGNARTTFVADLPIEEIQAIARMKADDLQGADLKAKSKEIIGTCVSMGVTVEGFNAREAIKKVAAGDFDDKF